VPEEHGVGPGRVVEDREQRGLDEAQRAARERDDAEDLRARRVLHEREVESPRELDPIARVHRADEHEGQLETDHAVGCVERERVIAQRDRFLERDARRELRHPQTERLGVSDGEEDRVLPERGCRLVHVPPMLRTVSLGVHVYPLAELKRTDREGEAFLRDAFARIDVVLARAGLAHVEPEEGRARWPEGVRPEMPVRAMEQLASAVAEAHTSEVPRAPYPWQREQLHCVALRLHLVCHARNAGLYLPLAFDRPLHARGDDRPLPGGLVGSAVRVAAELDAVREQLGIHDPATDASDPLRSAWHTMRTAAALSMSGATAIWLQ
jgi:hypothetical protein